MKNDKILATLAVLAMVFAGVAVYAEQADATSSGAIAVDSSVNEGRTIQVTYTLTLSDDDANKPLKGYTITWAVVGNDGVAPSTDATIVGTASPTTSVTDVAGKAYATLTGAQVNENATVKIKATVAKPAGGVSVADVTSAAITVTNVTNPMIGSWTVTEASNFASDNSSRMYVFQYTDSTLVIDTRYMTNLLPVSNVHVGLAWGASAPGEDTGYTLVNTLGVNQKLFIDLKDKTQDTLNDKTLWVKLFNYDGNSGALNPLSVAISLTVNLTTPASTLALVPQYDNTAERTHTTAAVTYSNLVRNESFTLDDSRSVQLIRSGYELVAWSHNSEAVDGYKDGNGSKDVPVTALPIEEILMLVTQASPVTITADEDEPAYTDHKTNATTTIYGVWEKKFYTIAYVDSTAATIGSGLSGLAIEAADGASATMPVGDISGSTVIGGEETSFGIISVVKKTAAATTGTEYYYFIKVMDEDGETIVDYSQAPISKAAVQIDMINNGTWKIHHVTQNLKISARAVATTALETGADFAVNYIKNNSTDKNGEARLTLDLNDYPNMANQEIYMKGTYYRVLTDLEGVRVYGNIDNLTVLGDGTLAISAAANAERTYTAYVDKVEESASYVNAGGTAAAETKIPGKAGEDVSRAGNLDAGKLYTTIGAKGYEYQGGHSYDLVLKTKSGTAQGIYLYGIQGVWDTDGQVWNANGTALDTKTTTNPTIYTPWAIYEDNSDGQ